MSKASPKKDPDWQLAALQHLKYWLLNCAPTIPVLLQDKAANFIKLILLKAQKRFSVLHCGFNLHVLIDVATICGFPLRDFHYWVMAAFYLKLHLCAAAVHACWVVKLLRD